MARLKEIVIDCVRQKVQKLPAANNWYGGEIGPQLFCSLSFREVLHEAA